MTAIQVLSAPNTLIALALLMGGGVLMSLLGALVIACALVTRLPPVIIVLTQGLLATAALFSAFTGWLGAGATTVWPGTSGALVIALLIYLSQSVGARRVDALRASYGGPRQVGLAPIIAASEMLVAAPTFWIYGYLLGLQVAI